MTRRTTEHLRHRGIPFDYINIEREPEAAAWVRAQNDGKEVKPTVDVGGQILAEPTNQELDEAL